MKPAAAMANSSGSAMSSSTVRQMLGRRQLLLLLVGAIALLVFFSSLSSVPIGNSLTDLSGGPAPKSGVKGSKYNLGVDGGKADSKERKPGVPIMSKIANETLKAELGRATWKLLHTMAGKYPLHPDEDAQQTMLDYIYLFARLYPCGDCARHFRLVLEKHPPDVSNREALSQWACKVHNVVNERLKHPIFDCSKVLEVYKCGCAEEDEEEMFGKKGDESAEEED